MAITKEMLNPYVEIFHTDKLLAYLQIQYETVLQVLTIENKATS